MVLKWTIVKWWSQTTRTEFLVTQWVNWVKTDLKPQFYLSRVFYQVGLKSCWVELTWPIFQLAQFFFFNILLLAKPLHEPALMPYCHIFSDLQSVATCGFSCHMWLWLFELHNKVPWISELRCGILSPLRLFIIPKFSMRSQKFA